MAAPPAFRPPWDRGHFSLVRLAVSPSSLSIAPPLAHGKWASPSPLSLCSLPMQTWIPSKAGIFGEEKIVLFSVNVLGNSVSPVAVSRSNETTCGGDLSGSLFELH